MTKNTAEETVPLSKYLQLEEICTTLKETCLELKEKNFQTEQELAWLKRNLFGKKSEKFIPNEQQQSLDLGIEPVEVSLEKERIEYDRTKPVKKKEGHGRGEMPTHLPFKDTAEPVNKNETNLP